MIAQNVSRTLIDSLNRQIRTMESANSEKADMLCKIAAVYSQQENYYEAKKANFEALEIYKNVQEQGKVCKVLLDIGMLYDKDNQYDQAFKYSFEALEMLELLEKELPTADYNFRRGMILMNIGVIYGQLENSEMSLEMLTKANMLLEKSEPFYQAICHENLGNVYIVTQQYELALIYFDKALTYYKNNDVQVTLIANTYNNIGNIYKETKRYQEALVQYQKAMSYFEGEEIYLSERIGILNRMGDLYIDLNNFNEAQRYLDSAVHLTTGEGGKRYIINNYKSLVKLYSKQGKHQEAFENLRMLKSIEDSLYEPEVLENIARIQKDYDFKATERENALKIELLENQQKTERYQWYGLAAVAIIVFLVGLLWFFKQQQRAAVNEVALKNIQLEKQQLSDQVKFNNNQLTNYAVSIVQKNEFLEMIKMEIDNLSKNSQDNKDVKSLSSIVNQHLLSSGDRKDFEIRIEQENQDFYYKLDKNFPDLSDKNKKLCSLLLLDLSSKEIATLMNISVGSVEKSRHRLRKKLNLESDVNISEFLNNL